ncbi:MAG: 3-methyl-2-oxobutanoate hydroxymethyltransferase, partial [Lysobacterales bacterium]
LQAAGAQLLVLECVPATLGRELTAQLDIPLIGIGAGADCDGQVLVMHDMLGLGGQVPRFVANFMRGSKSIGAAFESYVSDVRSGRFPAKEHQYA